MRLWSISFSYLDSIGLVALWKEALLAKTVLEGKTLGYRNHPQLNRFKRTSDPLVAINTYLYYIYLESEKRGFSFHREKLDLARLDKSLKITITQGQLDYEFLLLKHKLRRSPEVLEKLNRISKAEPNNLFRAIPGEIEPWERVKDLNIF